jgi:metallophosphoesterase (TIGR00282 family)
MNKWNIGGKIVLRILAVGDIVGRPGRKILSEMLPRIKREHKIDFCIANGENAATGNGITSKITKDLYNYGVDAITLGNHTWAKKEIYNFIDDDEFIVRPANFSDKFPGRGSTIVYKGSSRIGIVNICGRVYIENELDCPFKAVDKELEELKKETDLIIVDFHAETTSEKIAMGWYLDGRVSVMFGTHNHVQTADERILPNGTGFITDIGMTGPYNSVLGIDKDVIIKRFTSEETTKFRIADGDIQFNGAVFDIDEASCKCTAIEKVKYVMKNF